LFTGPASERRRFIDRLALSLDPGYASAASIFDRAMRQRNKALESLSPPQLLDALEAQMAEAAVAIALARNSAVRVLAAEIELERARAPDSAFPWASLSLAGHLEEKTGRTDAAELQKGYEKTLTAMRERDRAAGRTLIGPHRSDLETVHGPKNMPAKMCSTGEQKALLVGLVLAQARLVKQAAGGLSPLILLDEIAAHLDSERRLALFSSIASLKAQVWMTGTDREIFAPLREVAETQVFLVSNGSFSSLNDAESAPKP
jgi:DNA replication and repair protein RecF